MSPPRPRSAQSCPPQKLEAFDQIYGWSKRYWGLEVEDLNRTLPVALGGAKGANWLTLIGNELWQRLEEANDRLENEVAEPLHVYGAAFGKVIIAGERPVLADRNRGEFPDAYAMAERMIEPVKITEHPEFPGRFEEESATMPWLRRLTHPDEW
jgi:hypothetical protein